MDRVGIAVVVALGLVAIIAGESSAPSASAQRDVSSTAIFRAELPVVLAPDTEDDWIPETEYQALLAQGKTSAAEETEKQFEIAWQYADVELTRSRL